MAESVGENGTWDVIIAGGGPVGSTCAALLKKYDPDLRVLVLEKEKFPRDHVGESQLPSVSAILHEMGCWEKVEAANFPVKIGASLTWGRDNEAWDFDFYPAEEFIDEPRPAKYEGQRTRTAFQVDRAVYDDILLRHVESMGAEVREQTRVDEVTVEGDRIVGLKLSTGETVRAKWYVDATGAAARLRRALGIETDAPHELRNIAVWDYWENAEWAVEIGVGATRVLVRSLPYGWIWFIPLGPARTSIGLICPSSYYVEQGVAPEDLYRRALDEEPQIASLIRNATPRGKVQSCKDWSFVAHRLAGENWFLAGEAAGFADPILAAGLTLHQGSARDVAYTILELERGEHDPQWLRDRYESKNRTAIRQHIRFAQFWYSANGCFGDLQDHCAAIAREVGLRLTGQQAWRWLAQGGFINDSIAAPQIGSFDIFTTRSLIERFRGAEGTFAVEAYNMLKLNLHGTTTAYVGDLRDGRIHRVECYEKAGKRLPKGGAFGDVVNALNITGNTAELAQLLKKDVARRIAPEMRERVFQAYMEALETMIHEGWVIGKRDKKKPHLKAGHGGNVQLRSTAEGLKALEEAKAKRRGQS